MIKAGITGGIGSGKSTVCHIFRILGIPVYDADSQAKRLMEEDMDLVEAIKTLLGSEVYFNGKLNREAVSSMVFNDKTLLSQLNALVHPTVLSDSKKWMELHNDAPYTIKEAALLFESGSYKSLDKIITVTASEALRIQRTVERDHVSPNQVKARMANQWPQQDKIDKSDFIIENDRGSLLIPQVLKIHRTLKKGLEPN